MRIGGRSLRASRTYLRDGRSPLPKTEATSRAMSANRSKGTIPEVTLRRELARLGVRGYRLSLHGVPGRPDIAFPRTKVAVFVHGCFWHSCPRCRLPLPRTHRDFWRMKFARNRARDRAKEAELRKIGWRVIVLWECEIREEARRTAARVLRILNEG